MQTTCDDRTREELLAVSFHEAGHAVIGVLFGCSVEHATIEINESQDTWGSVRCTPPLDATKAIALLCAGYTAEYRAARRFVSLANDDKDFMDIRNVLAKSFPDAARAPRESQFRRGIELSMRMVRQHWPAIKHVARRLRAQTTIDGHEIRQIVQKHRRFPHALRNCH